MIAILANDLREERARFWFNELPDAQTLPEAVFEKTIESFKQHHTFSRSCAVEVSRHIGPIFKYGLLGASFHADASMNMLKIKVFAQEQKSEKRSFETPLGMSQLGVYVGLPCEFSNSVFETLINSSDVSILGAGELIISHAAYGLVGSSQQFFSRLSAILIQLLPEQPFPPDEKRLESILNLNR